MYVVYVQFHQPVHSVLVAVCHMFPMYTCRWADFHLNKGPLGLNTPLQLYTHCLFCRVAEIEAMQVEMTELKLNQPRDEVPFSPAGPLFSEQDM